MPSGSQPHTSIDSAREEGGREQASEREIESLAPCVVCIKAAAGLSGVDNIGGQVGRDRQWQ